MPMPKTSPEHSPARPIEYHLANATGELSELRELIERALSEAIPIVTEELGAEGIDIIILADPERVIKELGVSGSSYHPNRAYVYVDPQHEGLKQEDLLATLLHEIHHCMRWRNPGWGDSLGEAMISEGLACLFEEEHTNKAPIYATGSLNDEHVARAMQSLADRDYNHREWFFGSGELKPWFGYALGYKLCKDYSKRTGKSAAQLVHSNAAEILDDADGSGLN